MSIDMTPEERAAAVYCPSVASISVVCRACVADAIRAALSERTEACAKALDELAEKYRQQINETSDEELANKYDALYGAYQVAAATIRELDGK